jgi:hypothetical protein
MISNIFLPGLYLAFIVAWVFWLFQHVIPEFLCIAQAKPILFIVRNGNTCSIKVGGRGKPHCFGVDIVSASLDLTHVDYQKFDGQKYSRRIVITGRTVTFCPEIKHNLCVRHDAPATVVFGSPEPLRERQTIVNLQVKGEVKSSLISR